MTTFLHVGASTPVVSSCDVVRIAGVASRAPGSRRGARRRRALVGGDAADVVGYLPNVLGVAVVQRLPHLLGVLLVHAEDDGLGETVGPLQEVGEVARDRLGAGL